MTQRWKGTVNLNNKRGSSSSGFRVMASLSCSSTGALVVPASNAIFFVGDRVKDSGNPVVERLSQLENIAAALLSKLGQAVNLWIVEPSHYTGPFACYENILPRLTASGEPLGYTPNGLPAARACLAILNDSLTQVLKQRQSSGTGREPDRGCQEKESCNCDHSAREASPFEPFLNPVHSPRTILLGFSKGGVVLNQLLAEIVHFEESFRVNIVEASLAKCSLQEDDSGKIRKSEEARNLSGLLPMTVEEFLHRIEEVHYLDVGLNCAGAYQTDPRVLEGLAKASKSRESGFHVGLHGTPRQWHDHNRQWVGMEKNRCVELLNQAASRYGEGKLRVTERLYFGDKHPNLQMHFEIMESLILT